MDYKQSRQSPDFKVAKRETPHVLSPTEAKQIIFDGFFLARGNPEVSKSLYCLIGIYSPLVVKDEDHRWLVQQVRQEYGRRTNLQIHPRFTRDRVKMDSESDVTEFFYGVRQDPRQTERKLIRDFLTNMAATDWIFLRRTVGGVKTMIKTSRLCEYILSTGNPLQHDSNSHLT